MTAEQNKASAGLKGMAFGILPRVVAEVLPAAESRCLVEFGIGEGTQLLDYLNLTDRAHHKPSMLSGGEQQRVAVARALINNPAVILADEPSGNLDSQNAKELHELFFKLREQTGQTFVIVTHNPDLAQMADRTLTIKDGKIESNK